MSLVSKFKSYFALDDEYEYKEEVIEEEIEEPKISEVTQKPLIQIQQIIMS